MRFRILIFLIAVTVSPCLAQKLQPGFDNSEFRELLLVSVQTTADSAYIAKFEAPSTFTMAYQSKPMGLDNLWDLWVDKEGRGCISIRGTTMKEESWLANFYAAMVPAKGYLRFEDKDTFFYELAANPMAAVHVGWLLSMAYLSTDILPKIDSMYALGVKEYYIYGHSQGGAISYLLTAHLANLKKTGRLAEDLRFKTYCSAAPKPGNLYFAYEYEVLTQEGWGYNVVNALDWVPETPISIQTLDDLNPTNPFVLLDGMIHQQPVPARWMLNRIYKRLDKPTRKAQRIYEKYLGEVTARVIKDKLPQSIAPEFYSSSNYVRTGITIVMMPNEAYFLAFPEQQDEFFTHHYHEAYLFLAEAMK
ncbi:MAG TPA: lipase [Bacteroidetes bacterium]|nr:lipase [Bacteroidota bacterium]